MGKGLKQELRRVHRVCLAILTFKVSTMTRKRLAPWLVAGLMAVVPFFGGTSSAQQQQPATPAPAPAPVKPDVPNPTFRTSVNLVSSDVIVRNRRGQFQADLTKDDFEVYEDGVKQELNVVYARPRRPRVSDAVSRSRSAHT